MEDDIAPVPIEVPAPDPARSCSQVCRSLPPCFRLERTELHLASGGMVVFNNLI